MLDAKNPCPRQPERRMADRPETGNARRFAAANAVPVQAGEGAARWTTRRLLTVPGLSIGRP
jgi:hypothetical protein